MRFRAQQAVTILALLAAWLPQAGAQAIREEQVKAAVVMKVLLFVEWPKDALEPGSPLRVCLSGNQRLGVLIAEAAGNNKIDGHAIQIKRVSKAAETKGCHAWVIGAEADPSMLAELGIRPVLTIGESEGFANAGGILNVLVENGRALFELNVEAAKRAGLQLNSKLIRLAKLVGGGTAAK